MGSMRRLLVAGMLAVILLCGMVTFLNQRDWYDAMNMPQNHPELVR